MAQILSAGTLALALGILLVSINAMRVGLLTKFLGIIGIFAGALLMLPLNPLPVILAFWLLLLGLIFLGALAERPAARLADRAARAVAERGGAPPAARRWRRRRSPSRSPPAVRGPGGGAPQEAQEALLSSGGSSTEHRVRHPERLFAATDQGGQWSMDEPQNADRLGGDRGSPQFQELVHRRRRFVIPCTIFFLSWYMGFIVLCAYAPDFMGERVYEGLTVGYCLALTQFVMVFVLGIWYLRKAQHEFDPLADKGDRGVRRRRAAPGRLSGAAASVTTGAGA